MICDVEHHFNMLISHIYIFFDKVSINSFYPLFIFIYLFIYFFKFYLFLWLCWVFISVWGLSPVAASGGHSSSQCAGLSLSRPLLLWSTGSRHAGSVIVAHGPSRSAACGILPDQGSNPCPLHWQADSQPLRHQGSPSHFLIGLFVFLLLSFKSSLYILDTSPVTYIYICKYFLQVCGLSFPSLNKVHCIAVFF